MSDVETQLVRELRRIANVPDGSSFEIRHEGVRIRVEYTSGSSSSLVLFVPYDEVAGSGRAGAGYRGQTALSAIRPMNITLRRRPARNAWETLHAAFSRTLRLLSPRSDVRLAPRGDHVHRDRAGASLLIVTAR